ncbi:aminoglycoside phosphotransferase [Micromonospora sp. NPDC000663]|uniref:aminoglycoside phosphotransferase n=1 Tax=Micromonospora sp. NPDC000663 TaxID=3364218 RepID=UPI00368D190A
MTLPIDLAEDGWVAEELEYGSANETTGGVWRVCRDDGPAVLKVATPRRDGAVAHMAASPDPGHFNYWRREPCAYEAGVPASLFAEGDLFAPDCLAVQERADGSVVMWLEDVRGTSGASFGPAELGDIAYRLGVAQAAWVDRAPLGAAWLPRDFLADATLAQPVPDDVDWDHPVVASAWSRRLRAGLRRLWDRRFEVLAAARALPQTMCHHDLWAMNLIGAERGPVLLDWTFVGPGAIGGDVANMALDSFFEGLMDGKLLDEVLETVTESYVLGMRGVVEPDVVRRAIRVTGAARFFWLAPRMIASAGQAANNNGYSYDSRDVAERFAGRAPIFEKVAQWAESA